MTLDFYVFLIQEKWLKLQIKMSRLLIPVPPLAETTAGSRWYKPFTDKISFLSSTTPVISHLSISFKILCSLGDHKHKNNDESAGTVTSSGLGNETCPLRGDKSRTLKCVRSRTAFSPLKSVAQLSHTWPPLTSSVLWLWRQEAQAHDTCVPITPGSLPDLTPSLHKDSDSRNTCGCLYPWEWSKSNSQEWLLIIHAALTPMQMPNQLHWLSIGKK